MFRIGAALFGLGSLGAALAPSLIAASMLLASLIGLRQIGRTDPVSLAGAH